MGVMKRGQEDQLVRSGWEGICVVLGADNL